MKAVFRVETVQTTSTVSLEITNRTVFSILFVMVVVR